jgi:DNA-directed RNA polymerase subunit P
LRSSCEALFNQPEVDRARRPLEIMSESGSGNVFGSIVYECERCGTRQTLEELAQLPEIKCINCGYRVLKKVRPQVVKQVESV